jgi:hypothetical protein
VPSQSIVTAARYQPAVLGGRLAVTLVFGAIVSYLIKKESEELLPALSVQVPVRLAPVVSGPS